MAITVTRILNRPGIMSFDITTTADGDDNISLVHGKSSPPVSVEVTDRLTGLSKWRLGQPAAQVNGTTVVRKGVSGGSGDPGIQCTATLIWPQRHGN